MGRDWTFFWRGMFSESGNFFAAVAENAFQQMIRDWMLFHTDMFTQNDVGCSLQRYMFTENMVRDWMFVVGESRVRQG